MHMNSGRMNFLFDLLRSSCAGKGVEREYARLYYILCKKFSTSGDINAN